MVKEKLNVLAQRAATGEVEVLASTGWVGENRWSSLDARNGNDLNAQPDGVE